MFIVKALTNEQFLERVHKYFGSDYTFGPYKNMRTEIEVTHKCGNSYLYFPSHLVKGYGICHECYGKNGLKKDNDTFLDEVQQLTGDEYIFLQPYANNSTKLAVFHVDCGKVFYKGLLDRKPVTLVME